MTNIEPALLTRTEIKWLLDKIEVQKAYEYRMKSDIKKKLKTFTELELPLLIKQGIFDSGTMSKYTQNLMTNPQVKDHNNLQLPPDFQFSSQNMVGRNG